MPSYYYPELGEDSREIILEGEEYHHLSHVKRIAAGHSILLNGGNGWLAKARICQINKKRALLETTELIYYPRAKRRYAIAFSLLKGQHDELIIEKCTELGAVDFFPLKLEHTVKDEGKNTLNRFEKIALAAIKQCDNPWLPKVHPVAKLADGLSCIIGRGYLPVFCYEQEKASWIYDLDNEEKLCFIIGPEGGFSQQEQALMSRYKKISISSLICRAETAAIAISAQFQMLIARS